MHEICLWGIKETLGSHNSPITLFLLVTSSKFCSFITTNEGYHHMKKQLIYLQRKSNTRFLHDVSIGQEKVKSCSNVFQHVLMV